MVSSESKTRRRYGKSEWTKWESSRQKVWLRGLTITSGEGTFLKSRSVGKATSKRWLQLFGRRQNKQKSSRKLDIDHKHGHYYEHCSRSIVPREFKERQRCLPLISFSRRDEEIYFYERRTNSRNMGEPIISSIKTRKRKLVGKGTHDARLGCVV